MKQHFLLAFAALALIAFAGCSNENSTQESDVQPMGEVTEFASVDKVAMPQTSTRTKGIYNGFALKFYWTEGDKLWINNPAGSSSFTQSVKDDIGSRIAASKEGRADKAKFYFPGTYTAQSYKLRYTGKGNSASDKVTIKAQQTQLVSNDASHIGEDGDCGTATATKNGGRYEFVLNHKAAYLTFTPFYCLEELDNSVTIESIKVSANENLAGTFDFDDDGIQTASVTSPSKSVTLSLGSQFNIPHAIDYAKCAAIMVVAPGKYTNFTVEYTINDSKTGVKGTVSKTYSSVELKAGKNKPVASNFTFDKYDMNYYLWDAGTHYWDGYTGTLPVADKEQAAYPASGTNRDLNGNGTQLYAVNSCKESPNANEATLYAFKGDPHWDGTTLWVMNKHLYVGGMWFKKLQHCDGGPYSSPVNVYPNGKDYRNNSEWVNWDDEKRSEYHDKWVRAPKEGKPADTSQYFYLPARGYLDNYNGSQGKLMLYGTGYRGAYWTSTSVKLVNGSLHALVLHFSPTEVGIDSDLRGWGYPIFKVDNK